jgi:hypothetical protein
VIHAQALDLVHRQQDTGQKQLVLLLKGQRKSIDDGTQDLQQLGDAIVSLRLIHELEEDIVDGSSNV